MGILQLQQIKHRLQADIADHIDASDLGGRPAEDREKNVLSRCLAAYVIVKRWGWDAEVAAAAVTDGEHDGGLDAIAIDSVGPRLLLVQSKWSDDGTGSASMNDMLKFREGIDRLIKSDWSYFSQPIQSRSSEIEEVIMDASVRIELVFAHSGSGALADEVSSVMDPLIDDLNELEDIAQFVYAGQSDLHTMLSAGIGEPIDIEIDLSDWGILEGPVRAFYGHISALTVAQLHKQFGDSLFAKNLRATLPFSAVNDAIITTVKDQPDYFWYFNNGVTILCERVSKAPAGGSDRRVGHFEFKNAQIVNGAQTVGSIGRALGSSAELSESNTARVMVRFIELASAPEGFGSQVTRSTNTQNRIGAQEFLALDREQARIAREFQLDDRQYVFRSGEEEPEPDAGCGVREATVALACLEPDIRLAVLAKREVGRLWADVERAPYKTLFNPGTHSLRVWRAVLVLRLFEARRADAERHSTGKHRNFLVQLNRVGLWTVNRHLELKDHVDDPHVSWDEALETVESCSDRVCAELPLVADAQYQGYPANLAKNAYACEKVAEKVLAILDSRDEAG